MAGSLFALLSVVSNSSNPKANLKSSVPVAFRGPEKFQKNPKKSRLLRLKSAAGGSWHVAAWFEQEAARRTLGGEPLHRATSRCPQRNNAIGVPSWRAFRGK
jgi:hypothetical protein